MKSAIPVHSPVALYFRYGGSTALTVIGAVTGKRYRFEAPGAILAVDDRDAPSMSGVPKLHRAPAPD